MSSEQTSTIQRVAELRDAMLAEVKPEDLAAIMRTMLELAKEGNLQAAKLVLTYMLGKPEPLAKGETSGGGGRPAPSAVGGGAQVLPESLGVDVKELLKGAPSSNGVFDDLREMRLITPARGTDGISRKKDVRKS